jgi:peptidoglycan hydrolase CwlO-like protein
MLNNLRLILAGAAAAVMFGGGYMFGARKVDALEAQIRAIKSASDDTEAKRKKSQEDISKMLKDKDAEYAKQAQQLRAKADQRAKDLAAALAGANSRIESLQAQVSGLDTRRAKLAADRDAAPTAAERKKFQDQIDALDQEKKTLMTKVDANACLALAVPEAVIGPQVQRR